MAHSALVIGGGSFVGRHLVRRLRDGGADVLATARQVADHPDFVPCDLTDEAAVERVVTACRPHRVFQCGAVTSPAGGPDLLYRVHVAGTLNLLRALARHSPGALVVLFGSAAEYGRVPEECLPIGEEQPPQSLSFYGASKLAQTQLAGAAAAAWGLRILVVRPFNVLGPGLPAHYLAGALARRLLREGPGGLPFPVANGAATRDFVDVRDVAEAVLALAERACPAPGDMQVYNIASGVETPILAVAARLCALAGERRAVDEGGRPSRSGVGRSRGGASKLSRATGWVPRITWERSVEDLWRELQGGMPAVAA